MADRPPLMTAGKRIDVTLAHSLRGTRWDKCAHDVVREVDALVMYVWKLESDIAKLKRDTPKFQGMTELA